MRIVVVVMSGGWILVNYARSHKSTTRHKNSNEDTILSTCLTTCGMLLRPSRYHRMKLSGVPSHRWMRALRASPGTQLKPESLQSCCAPAALCSVCHLTESELCTHSCTLLRKHRFKVFTTKQGLSYEVVKPWKQLEEEAFQPTSPWRRRLRTKLCLKV